MMTANAPTAEHLSRLRWRCRRGMRELDVVLVRYLDLQYASASSNERQAFEALLELQDPLVLAYLLGQETPTDAEQVHVVRKLAVPRAPTAAS